MGRWDNQDNSGRCQKCGRIHDCEFYDKLVNTLKHQMDRFNEIVEKNQIMFDWFDSTITELINEKKDPESEED
jgi:Zn-finger protein